MGAKLTELNTLLAEHWDPVQKWDSNASRLKAQRLQAKIGVGYEDATRSLINQTGHYCAYCDAPIFSNLRAAPILPLRWFPAEAFDYNNLLLLCPACRNVKDSNPLRSAGSASELQDTTYLAWPHRVAQGMLDGALLPFRYDLVRLTWTFGGPRADFLEREEIDSLLHSYRNGYVRVERAENLKRGRVLVWPPGSEIDSDVDLDESQTLPPDPTAIGVWLSPSSTGRPIEAGIQRFIDLVQLNTKATFHGSEGLDRRFELRTMTYLKALDLRDRMVSVLALGDTDLLERILDLWRCTIQATGFWGVWLSVFRDVPDIQIQLAALMPGTATPTWVL